MRYVVTNCSEILCKINTFSLTKMLLKMSSAKWRPFCLGLNVLMSTWWQGYDVKRFLWFTRGALWTVSILKTSFPGVSIPIINITRFCDCPTFIMGIPADDILILKYFLVLSWNAHRLPRCTQRHEMVLAHDDVIKWKHFPRYWPFVRGIHRSPVNSPHKGQWRGALMFTLICVRINGWVNNREAGDFRRHLAHYDVIVMGLRTESASGWFSKTNAYEHLNSQALKFSTKYQNRTREAYTIGRNAGGWHLEFFILQAKQPWWIWINTSCEFIMNDCITTTKQSTTKPCAYLLGYTVAAL